MQYQYINYKQTQKYKRDETFKTNLNKSFNIIFLPLDGLSFTPLGYMPIPVERTLLIGAEIICLH